MKFDAIESRAFVQDVEAREDASNEECKSSKKEVTMEHTLVRKFKICDLRSHATGYWNSSRAAFIVKRDSQRETGLHLASCTCEGVETRFPLLLEEGKKRCLSSLFRTRYVRRRMAIDRIHYVSSKQASVNLFLCLSAILNFFTQSLRASL